MLQLGFWKAYIKSMRLYYAFITGVAGWVGVSFYQFAMPDHYSHARAAMLLVMLFLSWGINQIINDYLGLPEDRINAPNRPMVTGELDARNALIVSGVLMTGVVIISWQLNPWSVLPVILGVLLNILYEYAKAWSLTGNAIFGLSIAMCTAYGFLAAGPLPSPVFTTNRISGFILVAFVNGLMTFYTYFKDYEGDKAAGKHTFVVRYGLNVARYAGLMEHWPCTSSAQAMCLSGSFSTSTRMPNREKLAFSHRAWQTTALLTGYHSYSDVLRATPQAVFFPIGILPISAPRPAITANLPA
jgi:geranylgeranylglycerol-phosphate geranylgeranyltransferase